MNRKWTIKQEKSRFLPGSRDHEDEKKWLIFYLRPRSEKLVYHLQGSQFRRIFPDNPFSEGLEKPAENELHCRCSPIACSLTPIIMNYTISDAKPECRPEFPVMGNPLRSPDRILQAASAFWE